MEIRIGNGFDVHKFVDAKILRLCGVDIEFDKGLIGHSDADVVLHALTDAILGALGKGDIGTWFPPSDNKWKNADSKIFLEFANNAINESLLKISNIDITIICEKPKIQEYSMAMKNKLSRILMIETSQINIKGTTTEKLGFTGREEGIACLCSVLLSQK